MFGYYQNLKFRDSSWVDIVNQSGMSDEIDIIQKTHAEYFTKVLQFNIK